MKSISLLSAFAAATLFVQLSVNGANQPDGISIPAPVPAPATTAKAPAPAPAAPARNSSEMVYSMHDAELLKRYDKNGDGKIDEDEKAEAKLEMLKNGEEGDRAAAGKLKEQMLKRFDKNHDGKLDEGERAEMFAAMQKNPRFIKRFDKNGDGKLDDAEMAAARQQIEKRWGDAKTAKKN